MAHDHHHHDEGSRHAHEGDAHGGAHDHGHRHAGGHEHPHGGIGHVHGDTSSKRRVALAAVLTGGFMAAEAAGGWLTGSLALLADAGHMLTDTVSLGLAWAAFSLAGRRGTASLTYGFDRVKTLAAYTNGLSVFAIGLWILYEAALRLLSPQPVLGGAMLGVAALGLAVNVASFLVLSGGAKNLNMRGAVLHVMGDLLGSVAALAAAGVIVLTGWTPIDPLLSALVAVILFRSAWALTREAGHLLLEGTPGGFDRGRVAADLEAHVPGLAGVHHVHLWSLDGENHMATLHASLLPGTDAQGAIAAVKRRLAATHGIAHATVEPEYGACADGVQDCAAARAAA
jgi:cobalt-zinc-cadmium efflux system protein